MKYPYIWKFWRQLKLPFFLVSIALIAQVGLVIVQPMPAKYMIDHLITGKQSDIHKITFKGISLGDYNTYNGLIFLSVLTLVLSALLTIAEWLEVKITSDMVFKTATKIRADFFQRLFTRKQAYLDSKKKVDILGRISGDVANLDTMIVFGVPALVRAVPTMIALYATMMAINAKFTLVFTVCLPFFYFFTHYFTAKLRETAKQLRRRTVSFEEETYEAASAMAIVKSLKGDKKLLDSLLLRNKNLTESNEKFRDATLWLETSIGSTHHIVRVVLLLMGSISILNGHLSVGDLYVFMSYLASIVRPMNDITKFVSRLTKCSASMDRVEEFDRELESSLEISGDKSIPVGEITKLSVQLSFRELSFQYKEGKKIFDRYNIDFPNKRLIAVVGQSGIGKSSFSRLLNRLQDPISGEVLLGGRNISEFKLSELRSYVRVISQETFIISGTIRENLLLAATKDYSDEILKEALEKVNALEFVQAQPLGLETIIGEGGQQLSGGQAKRIHLARSFLDMESEILIFDEPTTGLDTHSAQKVMESVQKIAREKSMVFWITHRMQEVHSTQNVLFFQANENPIFSTHEALFKENQAFRALMQENSKSGSTGVMKEEMPLIKDTELDFEENLSGSIRGTNRIIS